MKTIFIYPNKRKAGIYELVQQTCAVLREQGARVILPRGFSDEEISGTTAMELDSAVKSADFIVVLGGDGTILRIARLASIYHVPLVGVNLGHVGFMTELERDEIALLKGLFEQKYELDNRMMLRVVVKRNERCIYHSDALNDITVSKANPFHVIELRIMADEASVMQFDGDGVIIATPTGTTAYSLAAGGPIVEPSAENIAVTPVCAHALQAKSFVFAPNRKITVIPTDSRALSACVSADGDTGFELHPGDAVCVEKSAQSLQLVRLKGKSFYQILSKKLSTGSGDL